MIFKPKKDMVYGTPIWLVSAITFLGFLLSRFAILPGVFFICTLLLSIWIWNDIEYRIENGELIIHCWIFRKRVRIADIVSVAKTRNLYSAYAISADRLELKYNQYDVIYIAPLDEHSFVEAIKAENPKVKVQPPLKV
jgi:hypothetical protein